MLYPACIIPSPDRIHLALFGIHSPFTTIRLPTTGKSAGRLLLSGLIISLFRLAHAALTF
ncbi:hypothetical protein A678_02573 [Salmonella enterica subsp. enterica serovar Enteritidis str. 2010K-0271]|nr:hypothetical protein A678_02573 [Salmonella enterica subsp. enterica serovar Enteritidis str. 2010K-0271]